MTLTIFICPAVQLGFALVGTHIHAKIVQVQSSDGFHNVFVSILPLSLCVQHTDTSCALQLTIGSVRAKSAKSVALKNIMDAAFGGVG